MEKKIDLDENRNKTEHIPTEEFKYLVNLCLKMSELENVRGNFEKLGKFLNERTANTPYGYRFFYNKLETIETKQLKKVPIQRDYLAPLLKLAGFADLVELTTSYRPEELTAMYTTKPFHFFDLMRLTDEGKIVRSENQWNFTGKRASLATNKILELSSYKMKGDLKPHWIKVAFETNGIIDTAFFAETPLTGQAKAIEDSALFKFFLSFLSTTTPEELDVIAYKRS